MIEAGLIILCLLTCALVLFSEKNNSRKGKWLSKPLASATFIALALHLGALETVYGNWLLLGLCLSWLGDLLLIPKERKELFLAGIGSFLLAHVAYSIAFLSLGFDAPVFFLASLLALVLAVLLYRWLARGLSGLFVIFVPLYLVVIMVMVVFSLSTTVVTGDFMLLLGAVLFAISDVSVARDRFIAPGFINRLWGLPLYYIAQIILALSVAR